MDDTIIFGSHGKVADAKLGAVGSKCLYLFATYRVINALLLVAWSVMVGHCHHMVGAEYADVLISQCVERLRCSHLMTLEAVDVKLCGTIRNALHNVRVPDFVE